MARGKAIPEAVQWIIIRLSTVMAADDVAMYTDVGVRSVNRVLRHFKQTGEIKGAMKLRGRLHQTLCNYDVQVSLELSNSKYTSLNKVQYLHARLNAVPILNLDELRMELQETCGVAVSDVTIWRTLVKGGYSMKKVRLHPLNTLHAHNDLAFSGCP
jgi:transposase